MNEAEMLPLTKALRASLRTEIRRTGVTAAMLLKNDKAVPPGLTSSQVNRWIGGMVRAAPKDHVEHVVARWAALPEAAVDNATLPKRGRRHHRVGQEWVAVTEEMARFLRAEFVSTGLDQRSVLVGMKDVPLGLTARVIQGWLYQEAATTRAGHWAFVTGLLGAAATVYPSSAGDRPLFGED